MAKSLWEELTDLFKTDEQREEERKKQMREALKGESSILGQLYELDKEYKASLPDDKVDYEALFPKDSGLKEIEYALDSDEDIAELAQKENALGKSQDTASLNSKYEAQKSALEKSKAKADENLKSGYEQLSELYDQLRKRTENDALKRGLARSSIVSSQLGDLNTERMKGAGELQASYNSTVSDIEGSIEKLEAEKDIALENLDIKYALELESRINELTEKRDKTAAEYEKYNADVRKKNQEYEKKRQEDMTAYATQLEKDKLAAQEAQEKYEKKYGLSGAKQENYAKRYEIAFDFYSSLSPDIAADALQASPNMQYYLGTYYYNTLLKALQSNNSGTKRYF